MSIKLTVGGFEVALPHQRTAEQSNPIKLQEKFKACFENEAGAEVLSYLLYKTGGFNTTYTLGDPYHTAHLEGSRRLVSSILTFLTKTPEDLIEYLKEQEKEP